MVDYKRKTSDERKKELDALTRQLHDGIHEYIGSQRYSAVLDSMSRFHNYSINNSIIIGLQNPQATRVASFSTWKKLNRIVKKGEQGIAIFCPYTYRVEKEMDKVDPITKKVMVDIDGNNIKEKKLVEQTAFKIGYVFDVNQTEQIKGKKEIPLNFVDDLENKVESYEEFINSIKMFSPVPIEFENYRGNSKGYFSDKKNKIVVKDNLSESQTIKTLIHEIAHAYLHGKNIYEDNKQISFSVKECGEFSNLGEYHENLNLEDAVRIYNSIPKDRINGIKSIDFVLHDDSIYDGMEYPIVSGDIIQIENINLVPHLRDSFQIQRAITELQKTFIDDGFLLQSTRELQAESVAYIVCHYFGIDTSDYSFGYVATWMKNEDQFLENLEVIKSCSNEIIDGLEATRKNLIREEMNVFSEEDMVLKIDNFMMDFDTYDYSDNLDVIEEWKKDLLISLKNGETETVRQIFKDIIDENRNAEFVSESKKMLKALSLFEKKPSLDLEISKGRGMKR